LGPKLEDNDFVSQWYIFQNHFNQEMIFKWFSKNKIVSRINSKLICVWKSCLSWNRLFGKMIWSLTSYLSWIVFQENGTFLKNDFVVPLFHYYHCVGLIPFWVLM
jgi:hypothetical protein